MTLMTRQVRVSVRTRTETTDSEWGVPSESYEHVRFQRIRSLVPLNGDEALRLQRQGVEADWHAQADRRPSIPDGARLVTFDENERPDAFFHVEKVLPHGRRARVLLREVFEDQS